MSHTYILNSGNCWYFRNSASQSSCVWGGFISRTKCQSTIESPDSVNLRKRTKKLFIGGEGPFMLKYDRNAYLEKQSQNITRQFRNWCRGKAGEGNLHTNLLVIKEYLRYAYIVKIMYISHRFSKGKRNKIILNTLEDWYKRSYIKYNVQLKH